MEHGVGRTLREARRRRRVDLAEVEAETKIRSRFLLALENEEWDALPAEAYARGFIRTYAGYLGLDGTRLAEEHRRDIEAHRPEQRLPVDPTATPVRAPRTRPRSSRRLLAALVSVALVAVLVVLGLSSEGEEGPSGPDAGSGSGRGSSQAAVQAPPASPPTREPSLSVHLTATAEVWVCLLDAGGEALVNGQILPLGAEAGPFRSGSFTVSFGNGEVSMTVNGKQANIPATSSPIGYTIDADGALRELSEGERPTCT